MRVVSLHRAARKRAPMERLEQAEIREDYGLVGDRRARSGSMRQINLVDAELLRRIEHETGWSIPPGTTRENVVIEGVDIYALRDGGRLRLGDACVLRVHDSRVPCNRMDEIQPGLKDRLAPTGAGVLCSVEQGGLVRSGDPVVVLECAVLSRPEEERDELADACD